MASVINLPRLLYRLFRPSLEALFTWRIPFHLRWRMLLLQPISVLTKTISTAPWTFTNAYTVEYITVSPGITLRILVFKAPGTGSGRQRTGEAGVPLRPLHLDIHGGGFIGGWPEDDALFCDQLARETGAVVVSISYRFAPAHVFPAAIDDVDAAIRFIQINAQERWGADATLFTASGFSAGGNLALAAAQAENCRAPSPTNMKGCVAFYAPIELRLKPHEKPIPTNVDFPTTDPLRVLHPLYDAYAAPARLLHMADPRLSPILADVDTLPTDILMAVAGIDILVHEQMSFVDRLRADLEQKDKRCELLNRRKDPLRRVELVYDKEGFHGYLNLPDSVIPSEKKQVLFRPAVQFIKDVHRKHHWQWQSEVPSAAAPVERAAEDATTEE